MNALLGEDAYAVTDDAPIELRILHGAQAGSRLCLAVGEYALGSDDSCTLILEGNGIEDRHAVLRFDGESAWIDPVDGFVRNAHGDEIDDEQALAFGVPVELGSVWLSVDREDAPWPDPKSVMPIGSRKNPQADSGLVRDALDELTIAAVEEPGLLAAAVSMPPPRGRKILTYGLLTLMVLAAGCLGAYGFFQGNQVKPVADVAPVMVEVVQAPPSQAALDVIKNYPRTRLGLQQEQGRERWVVTGYVAKLEEQRELVSLLATSAPMVPARVLVEEELLQSATQVLKDDAAATHVRVESATGGILQLAGAAASAGDVQHLDEKLRSSVTGVLEVKSQILLPAQLGKLLRNRIAAASLGDRLAIATESPEMTLSGRLTMEEIRRWEDLLVTFNREYGNVLPIRATVTRFFPKPPVGVQAIVGGAVPYIVTQGGEHINQGGDVNGHTLVSVKDGEVVFEGRQRVRIAR
nr:EscD/YscD/HrpQ family type III secretion system periplasmic domain-containing protein [uncultured Noviherbaspirillum sp.]